ncbi:hypothetical protein LTR56_009861 [Elasticomyces elasticus]|nr:hypothetical protein LTR56_009861 [Elasticomyces elasticus]KAK3659177.1 hypothetical protein LTR22_008640 [Elasticomyces elasticus]
MLFHKSYRDTSFSHSLSMKIILTGATGWVGGGILAACLSSPSITHIIAISRRPLSIVDSKLTVILHDDYTHYPDNVLAQLQGAKACIYSLGTNVPIKPAELNRKINLEFALATATLFAERFAWRPGGEDATTAFRFVYLSGALVEKDQSRSLWFLAGNRKMRGELENELLKLADANLAKGFEVVIARPGFVQPDNAVVRSRIVGMVAKTITREELARAMLGVAMSGSKDEVLENSALLDLGRRFK